MVIKQQIFKSVLELCYETQLDLAVRRYHGSFVLLSHGLSLEGDLGFLSIAYVNIACGVCTNKCFWGTLAVFVISPINYGHLLQEIIMPTGRS